MISQSNNVMNAVEATNVTMICVTIKDVSKPEVNHNTKKNYEIQNTI